MERQPLKTCFCLTAANVWNLGWEGACFMIFGSIFERCYWFGYWFVIDFFIDFFTSKYWILVLILTLKVVKFLIDLDIDYFNIGNWFLLNINIWKPILILINIRCSGKVNVGTSRRSACDPIGFCEYLSVRIGNTLLERTDFDRFSFLLRSPSHMSTEWSR